MGIPEIDKRIEEIANDKLSGASTLAIRCAECLDLYGGWVIENPKGIKVKNYLEQLIELGQSLIRAQPTMAAVVNSVNEIVSATKTKSTHLTNEVGIAPEKQLKYLCTYTQSISRKYIVESKLALETIAQLYNEVIHPRDIIMTISASSAVESTLIEAMNNELEFKVYVPESRPMYEGRLMAERLATMGIETILIADSAIFHYLKECSGVLVGADRVTPAGIMNKIGTYGLAIAAKEIKKPVYCICERSKFIPKLSSLTNLIVDQPEAQLYCISEGEDKPKRLTIKNIYFDFTPIEYITNFLTEEGLLTIDQVVDYIRTLKIMPEFVYNLKRV